MQKINDISDSKRQQTITTDYKRLFNGLVLTSVVTLHRQTKRSDTTNQIFSFIIKHTHIMSTMRNSVTLIGRPGAEPEMRVFNSSKMARFRMAVNERRRNANNEWVDNTQWFPIVAWGNVADRVEKSVKKGQLLAIDGSLRNNEWTDDKGQRHSTIEININDLFPIEKSK